MDVARIIEILEDSIVQVDDQAGPPEGTQMFDLYMVMVPLETQKVQEYAAEMIALLREWPDTSYGYPVPRLGQEIDYITAGAVLGDQGCAFMLFAFGLALEWWDLLDPRTVLNLDKESELGMLMAGKGMIAVFDYRPGSGIK